MPNRPSPDGLLNPSRRDLFVGPSRAMEGELSVKLKVEDLFYSGDTSKLGTSIGTRIDSELARDIGRLMVIGQQFTDFPRTESDFLRNAVDLYVKVLRQFTTFPPSSEVEEIMAHFQMREVAKAAEGRLSWIHKIEDLWVTQRKSVIELVTKRQFKAAARLVQEFLNAIKGLSKYDREAVEYLLARAGLDTLYSQYLDALVAEGYDLELPTVEGLMSGGG